MGRRQRGERQPRNFPWEQQSSQPLENKYSSGFQKPATLVRPLSCLKGACGQAQPFCYKPSLAKFNLKMSKALKPPLTFTQARVLAQVKSLMQGDSSAPEDVPKTQLTHLRLCHDGSQLQDFCALCSHLCTSQALPHCLIRIAPCGKCRPLQAWLA